MSDTHDAGIPASAEEKRRKLAELLARKAAGPKVRPASFAQQRLWFLHRLEPASPAYNISFTLLLKDPDVEALERAFTALVRRHETLRTTLREEDGEPVQVVHPAAPVALPVEAVPAVEDEASMRALQERVRRVYLEPYDLEAGPLFRARLFRVGDGGDHVVALGIHHVVGDGWSLKVLHGELQQLYEALRAGREPALPPLPVQYGDFAAWQRKHLQGEVLEAQLGWWRAHLAGAPTLLALPTDRPRPPVQQVDGLSADFPSDPALGGRIRAAARGESATPFVVMLAAWYAFLHRLTGEEEVIVGTPILGRTRAELETVVGYFANTLAVRGRVEPHTTFRALVRQVRETMLGAHAHQDVPFERLVDELKVERSLSHNPLYQVMFAWTDMEAPAAVRDAAEHAEADGAPPPIAGVGGEVPTAIADLMLTAGEIGDGVVLLRWSLASALFDGTTAARLNEQFLVLLDRMLADPDAPVAAIDFAPEVERPVLAAWAEGDALPAAAAETTVHALFEARAAAHPDRAAVVRRDGRTTYGALDARANRIAHRLRALGAGPERAVGVCLPRTADLVASLLGAWKAGGFHVPLDPASPAARVRTVLDDARAAVLVTVRALADALDVPDGCAVLALDDDDALAAMPETPPAPLAGPGNAAYAIYTSGSTGAPKGVLIEHRQTAAFLAWHGAAFSEAERSGVLGSTSLSFDVAVAEVWGALCHGGTLVLVDDALDLADLPADPPVRLACMAPSAAAEVLRLGAVPPTLRTWVLGGEAVPRSLADEVFARTGVTRLVNGYGPTEDTTYSTTDALSRDAADGVAIGRPLAGKAARVLDAGGNPVPVGVPGELWMAGAGTARGYLNAPAMTADRYRPDPLSPVPGARMYRVGDRVRWRADGRLEYLGRLDQQVKVRGFRVEPGEVEEALRAHPAVADAVVGARPEPSGGTRLVAWLLAAEGAAPDAAELRAHLRARLPDWMVPAAFAVVDAFPRTHSGKIDRRALPAPEGASGPAYEAPRTDAERMVAAVWAELLGVERVGANDHFFDLGGHSLVATRVVSRLREAHGVEVPLRALFEAPTVAELALRVEQARAAGAPAAPAGPIARADRGQRAARLSQLTPG